MTASAPVVLITAGASGIGLAIARAFGADGARVSICDVDSEAVERLRQEHPEMDATVCDVTNEAGLAAWVDAANEKFGGIDVVVCNAGISGPTAPVAELDPAAWRQVLDVNLTGAFLTCRATVPYLRSSSHGSVVVVSSLAGRTGYPERAAYCTSKWGLIGLTKTLSRELGADGVTVNAVCPGAITGPRFEAVMRGRAQSSGRSYEEEVADTLRDQSIPEFATAQDVADMVVYLCSSSARHISGQLFPIDGDTHIT